MLFKAKTNLNTGLTSSSETGKQKSHMTGGQELARKNTLDWNVEYIRAVRTTSYNDFSIKAQLLTGKGCEDIGNTLVSSSSKLGSFRFIADCLLEPDQEAVDAMLLDKRNWKKLEILELVSDYFDSSLKASSLCGTLLRSIEQARSNGRIIKTALSDLPVSGELDAKQCRKVVERLCGFTKLDNPFSEPSSQQFQTLENCYGTLHRRLQKNRKVINNRMRLLKCCKKISASFLIVALVGVAICAVAIATHALVALAAAPLLVTLRRRSTKNPLHFFRQFQLSLLSRHSAQLDAAARGTYSVNRVLDTMMRLVTRLRDEVEHNKVLIRFGWQHKEECLSVHEVVTQLQKNQKSMCQQLEELEEHVYLCFMTVNKARSLVVQEISPQNL